MNESAIPVFDADHFSRLSAHDLARLIEMSASRLHRFVSSEDTMGVPIIPAFLIDKELDLLSRRVNGYLLRRKRERGEA